MMTAYLDQHLEKWAYWILICVTLAITPSLSFDPINAPKYFVLVLGTSILLVYQLKLLRINLVRASDIILWLILVFIGTLCISLFTSKAPLQTSFFGFSGRNTGIITYICLALLMYIFYLNSAGDLASKTVQALTQLGFILSIYGIMQANDWEIFPYGASYGSSVFGTFGNSNFLSGFLGIAGSASAFQIFEKSYSKIRRAHYSGTLVLCIVVIWLSNSQQGFLSLAAGIGIGSVLFLFSKGKSILAKTAGVAFIVASVISVFSIFNKGPLASIVYQSSLDTRREYWYAAFQMIKNHPITGIGFDNFGSFYRQSRSLEMTLKNPDVVTDSAHNVFLDIATGGGIFALISYLSLILLTVYSVYLVTIKNKSNDKIFTSLVAAWCAYLVQGSISINNLGLAIWGWVIPGLIIGYRFRSKAKNSEIRSKERVSTKYIKKKNSQLVLLVPLLLGISAVPPLLSSIQFYSALQTGNAQKIMNSASLFPNDLTRYIYVATTLRNNELNQEAHEIIKAGLMFFPNSFDLWRLDSTLPPNYQIGEAKLQMKRLDPFNPNLK